MTSNADAIRRIFAFTCDDVYQQKGPDFTELLGPSSLFVLDGREHARLRRLAMPALHHERMQCLAGTLHELAEAAVDSWPLGIPFRLHDAMQALTLQILLHTLLGNRSKVRLHALSGVLTAASDEIGDPLMAVPIEWQRWIDRGPWPRLVRRYREAGELFMQEIRERRTSGAGAGPDVLSMLMQARDKGECPMTDGEIRDTLLSLIAAGHDTTASMLSWALVHLLEEPALCARLREEMRAAQDGEQLVAERISGLPLLDATVREVLRLHPVFPGAHVDLAVPMRLLDHDLPAGTRVVAGIYLAQRRPQVFPEPDRFFPDRFLRQRPTPFEWLPFGGGMRRCVGSASVLAQMKVVLLTILRRAVLQPVPGPKVRTIRYFLALAPSGGVPAVLVSRAARRRPGVPQVVQPRD